MSGSSQFKPLPQRERDICQRFSALRRFNSLSQAQLASALHTTRNQIANIESLRVPLRAGLASAFCVRFKANPGWLATGNGNPRFAGQIAGQCTHPDLLFSDYFDRFLSARFEEIPTDARAAISQTRAAIERANKSFKDLPKGFINKDVQILENVIKEIQREQLERETITRLVSGIREADLLNEVLTQPSTPAKTLEVKLLLPNLRERLNKVTTAQGKKSELAKFLGAPLASVSRWLSGDREPGGEITLKMLHWVEHQERK